MVSRLAFKQANVESKDTSQTKEEKDDKDKALPKNARYDKMVVWVSSNLSCLHNYTIAASTSTENIRLKYYGPITHLSTSTEELYNKGRCLILSHYHVLGMSENFTKNLKLDVIIHSED